MVRRLVAWGGFVVLLAGGLAACGTEDQGSASVETTVAPDPDAITVGVAFYPIEEVVRAVGGSAIDVVDLTPPGGEPHDLELTPEKAAALEGADVVFYLGRGFQPAVEDALATLPDSVQKVDLLDRVDLLPVTPQLEGTNGDVDGEVLAGNVDPHVWVDPANMALLTKAVEATLSNLMPGHAGAFKDGAITYAAKLTALDHDFASQLQHCESRTIVTSHRAFEYLAHHYDLEQIPIAGISPEEEPDPKSLEAVAAAAKADDVTVVFFEDRVPQDLSDTVAREIGASTDSLDPIETVTQDRLDAGDSYLTIQQDNLAALVKALRCR